MGLIWAVSIGRGGAVCFDGHRLQITGQVSMNSIAVDISSLRSGRLGPDSEVEVLGDHQSADDFARAAGTIGYEVLTGLGRRCQRKYLHTACVSHIERAEGLS
jgi:alanine racemase